MKAAISRLRGGNELIIRPIATEPRMWLDATIVLRPGQSWRGRTYDELVALGLGVVDLGRPQQETQTR